jgi:hypothetical protein
MAKYRIDGQVYDAASPEEAYALADERKRVGELGPLRQFGEATLKAFPQTGAKIGNLVGLGHLSPENFGDEAVQAQVRRNQELRNTNAGYLGGFTGDVLSSAPVGGPARVGLTKALQAAGATKLGNLAGQGAGRFVAEGAATGAALGNPGERGRATAEGAAWGSAFPLAGKALQKIAQPIEAAPEALELLKRKVRLTAGEMVPDSWLNQMEQALTSVPYLGPRIAGQRARSMGDWRQQVYQEGSAPGTTIRPSADQNEMFTQARQSWDQPYEEAVRGYAQLEPRIVGPMPPRLQGATSIPLHGGAWGPGAAEEATQRGLPGTFITDADRAAAAQNVRNQMSGVGRETTSGAELQAARSNLRTSARDAETPGQRRLTKAAADEVTQALESQLSPEDAARLRELDARYPNFVALRDAVVRSGDRPEGFTPHQLSTSVRRAADEGEYALGGGPLRDLSRAGARVFGARSPETGARQLTVGALKMPKAAAMAAANELPPELLAGLMPWQQRLMAQMAELRRYDATDPMSAALMRNLLPATMIAGE